MWTIVMWFGVWNELRDNFNFFFSVSRSLLTPTAPSPRLLFKLKFVVWGLHIIVHVVSGPLWVRSVVLMLFLGGVNCTDPTSIWTARDTWSVGGWFKSWTCAYGYLHRAFYFTQQVQDSITSFDNFNNIGLAKRLEKHELLEFCRLAAHLYEVCSFIICKTFNLWTLEKWTMGRIDIFVETRQAVQRRHGHCRSLSINWNHWRVAFRSSYFVDIGNKECFAALLYICFDRCRGRTVMATFR
jgi:hypothetical protein